MIQYDDLRSQDELIAPCNDTCKFCFLNYANVIGHNYLFRNINPKTIGELIRKVHHQVRKYEKGELIVSEGSEVNKLHIIVKGAVIGEMMDFEGKVLRVEQLSAPEAIGSDFLFGDNRRVPLNFVAKKETKILSLSREIIMELFKQDDTILCNYLNIVANRAQYMSKQIRLLGFQGIKGKLASYLLEIMQEKGSHLFSIPHTQSDLAEIFGVARPSLSRALREMDQEGYIRSRGKSIEILDRARLSELLK